MFLLSLDLSDVAVLFNDGNSFAWEHFSKCLEYFRVGIEVCVRYKVYMP